ncbi:helix-turn-helix domain-containing protein [Luteipulveratus sp. YIM 133132]|uniref:helix-turn-helix domain-containing protein n=1 Tax=Luteipulveratus flavus TaxID=3031728 RepID=UPI0023B0AC4D|nr:helix-turn-helix domain-containing protein [Luteipulveratus sp. YIM 133132]MDE9365470.1 helix-turn-helix domain-containing protein [Luteipulveratus sp. YIM 133132]
MSPGDVARLAAQGLSDREIGDALGCSSRTVLRHRVRHGIPSRWVAPLPEHGSRARYVSGCSCAACRRANNAHTREYVASAQRLTAAAPRYAQPWTPDEDAQLLSARSVAATALALGRTYVACRVRRAKLLAAAKEAPTT